MKRLTCFKPVEKRSSDCFISFSVSLLNFLCFKKYETTARIYRFVRSVREIRPLLFIGEFLQYALYSRAALALLDKKRVFCVDLTFS